MDKNLYSFGQCNICNKYETLKNGLCIVCSDSNNLPDFLKDLFKEKKDDIEKT
jgi:hypothetical protein